jgi:NTP pyrophosphatase (non-canonical NTP hydrolase)
MDLRQISELQIKLDEQHGFPVHFASGKEKYDQLTKDLVGLFGEIGEFANVVKKINIKLDRPDAYILELTEAETMLSEELVDSLIYIIRIGAILEIDLQKEILRKIQLNKARYAPLKHE